MPPKRPVSEAVLVDTSRRGLLICQLFEAIDMDHDGLLNSSEMLVFARKTGFVGSDIDWEKEYGLLFSEGHPQAKGISLNLLSQVIDDQSENGCYCTDDELGELIMNVHTASAAEQRQPTPSPSAQVASTPSTSATASTSARESAAAASAAA